MKVKSHIRNQSTMLSFFNRITKTERFSNNEGITNFNFSLTEGRGQNGVSALVRVKDEGQKILHCLRSIYELFHEIILVDNASQDQTQKIVAEFIQREDACGKVKRFYYPFKLSRFGPEHNLTDENSVHSAVYFSNWALSQCRSRYICKWDGDMVLRKEARVPFQRLLDTIHLHIVQQTCWTISGQTIYRSHQGNFYLAKGEINREIELFPQGRNPRFYKEAHWEGLRCTPQHPVRDFEPVAFYELKFVDEDEFAHWSTIDWPSDRKKREWSNFHHIKDGNIDPTIFEELPIDFLDAQLE